MVRYLSISTKLNYVAADGFDELLNRFCRRENLVFEVGKASKECVGHVSEGDAEANRGCLQRGEDEKRWWHGVLQPYTIATRLQHGGEVSVPCGQRTSNQEEHRIEGGRVCD